MPWTSGRFLRDPGDGGDTDRVWRRQRDAGTPINADYMDAHDADMADGISNCIHREGQNTASQVRLASGADLSAGTTVTLRADDNIDQNRVVKLPDADGTLVVAGGRLDHMAFGSDDSIDATHDVTIQAERLEADRTLKFPDTDGTLYAPGVVQDDVRLKQPVEDDAHPSYVSIAGDTDVAANQLDGEETPSKTVRIKSDVDDGAYIQVQGQKQNSVLLTLDGLSQSRSERPLVGSNTPVSTRDQWPDVRLQISPSQTYEEYISNNVGGAAYDDVDEIILYWQIPGGRRRYNNGIWKSRWRIATHEDVFQNLTFVNFNEVGSREGQSPEDGDQLELKAADLTADREILLPDADGTVALKSEIPEEHIPMIGAMVWRHVHRTLYQTNGRTALATGNPNPESENLPDNWNDLPKGWCRCDSSTDHTRDADSAARAPFDIPALGLSRNDRLPNPDPPAAGMTGYWTIYVGADPHSVED